MRLLIKLSCLKDCEYDLKYYSKLQGFIYNLLKNSIFSDLHNKQGYKFFCFSRIFPYEGEEQKLPHFKQGKTCHFLISSPNKEFLNVIKINLESYIKANKPVNIGEMSFEIKEVKPVNIKLTSPLILETSTPIIIRTSKETYTKFGVKPEKEYDYLFWRKEYPLQFFIGQIEENLRKKYIEFSGKNIENSPIFEQLEFIDTKVSHIIQEGKEHIVIGSLWKFSFSYLSPQNRAILEFAIDAGLGELNSLGFGFMNVVKNK